MSERELPPPQALIFDLDGTLVDTVDVRIQAWLQVFAEEGIAAERDRVAQLIGSDGKRLAREVAAAAGRQLDDARTEAIDRRSGEIYSELNTDPQPLSGVRPLLLALDESALRWAIATSSRAEQVMASVDALRLERRPMIVDGSHVERAKPEPDLLLLAAQQLSVAPGHCWYVGDATWDMLAARSGAMPAVGIATGSASPDELREAGADAVMTFDELHGELRRRGVLQD
ncbi:MAG: HAD family hydrolase [Chloroflexota bacterium]|nr:HAD family hydrolase [Chloroflexota bacterium]